MKKGLVTIALLALWQAGTQGNTRVGFRAATTVNRFDYGIRWNRALDSGGLIVSKDASITLSTEFVKEKGGG
jgi:polyisoprenoid-binding protein YceI